MQTPDRYVSETRDEAGVSFVLCASALVCVGSGSPPSGGDAGDGGSRPGGRGPGSRPAV